MAAAAHRDSIASEYATGYAIVFDTGLGLLADALRGGAGTLDAIVSLHLGLLASHPDTLIERKAGAAAARAVTAAAREVRDGTRSLQEFDASLRGPDHRLNPGDERRPGRRDAAGRPAVGGRRCREGAGGRRQRPDARPDGGGRRLRGDGAGSVRRRRPACRSPARPPRRSNDGLVALASGVDADAVVYGGGLENRPDLVARLADGRELLGTPPELLAAVRDPWAVGAAARAAGARAPETRSVTIPPQASTTGADWLRKPRLGGGGRGVRRWAGGRLRPREILQRRVGGLSCSAVAIGDGRRAALLGLTEQLHRRPGVQWTGNLTPPRLPELGAGRAGRAAARGLRRGGGALRRARSIRR